MDRFAALNKTVCWEGDGMGWWMVGLDGGEPATHWNCTQKWFDNTEKHSTEDDALHRRDAELRWKVQTKDTIARNQPESFAFHARSIFKSVDSHAFVLMVVHILRLCQLCQDIYIVHSTKSASGWRHSSICLRSPVSHKYPYSYTSNQLQQLTTADNNSS